MRDHGPSSVAAGRSWMPLPEPVVDEPGWIAVLAAKAQSQLQWVGACGPARWRGAGHKGERTGGGNSRWIAALRPRAGVVSGSIIGRPQLRSSPWLLGRKFSAWPFSQSDARAAAWRPPLLRVSMRSAQTDDAPRGDQWISNCSGCRLGSLFTRMVFPDISSISWSHLPPPLLSCFTVSGFTRSMMSPLSICLCIFRISM